MIKTAQDLQKRRLVKEAHQYLNEMNRLLAAVEERLSAHNRKAA
ncbi:hypothetical protein [Shewanella algae]|nr:hypothetical protein [Shewanella algae]